MNWKNARLVEVTSILGGTTPKSENSTFWNGNHIWVTPTDLGKLDTRVITDSARRITDAGLDSCGLPLVPAGAIVMSSRAPIGHLAIAGCDLHTNQGCKSFVCGEYLDSEFLFFTLQYRMADIQTLGSGATFVEVSKSALENFEIVFPDIQDQRTIAKKLTIQLAAVEEARQAAQTQLQEAKRLIPAILRAAFDNLTDAEWTPIGDVAKTTSGTTPSRGQKNLWEPPLHPWVKTGEVAFKTINQPEESVSAKALAECSLTLLPVGTVLVAMYGQGKTRGQSALLNVVATTNQACFAILPSEVLDPEYLQCWLRHSYEALRSLSDSRGGNQSNLNGALMNAFELPLLPIEQQKSIASHIKQAIADANALQQTVEMQLQDIELLPSRLLAQVFDAPD